MCVCARVCCFESPRKDLRQVRIFGGGGVTFELEKLFLTVSVLQQTKIECRGGEKN